MLRPIGPVAIGQFGHWSASVLIVVVFEAEGAVASWELTLGDLVSTHIESVGIGFTGKAGQVRVKGSVSVHKDKMQQ